MRTDRRNAAALAQEVREGRIRQGWGWLEAQDLRTLAQARRAGFDLTEEEQQSWRGNRRLLDTEPDSVQIGDIILAPHLPREGVWSLVRVTGPYSYEISAIASDKGMDYGHMLPVQVLTPEQGISPRAGNVSALLRRTMRNLSRMWNIDALGPDVERLLDAAPNLPPTRQRSRLRVA